MVWHTGVLCGFGAYALFWAYRMSGRIVEYRELARTVNLIGDMASVTKQLSQTPLSPSYIMSRLLDTSAKGAVWPTVLPCLIERAMKRDHPMWAA